MFAKRKIEPELMDHAPPDQARRNLADLTRINRFLGGNAVIRRTMGQVANREDRFNLLDIGAASGDTARMLSRLYPHAAVTSLDRNWVNLERAPRPKLQADAFHLPLQDASFDYVLCSLFLHHFEDDQVVKLLESFYCVARIALFVFDLERHILPYLFLPFTKPILGWHRITVYDGKISVAAAFRATELQELAGRAGLTGAKIRTHRPAFRVSLVASKD